MNKIILSIILLMLLLGCENQNTKTIKEINFEPQKVNTYKGEVETKKVLYVAVSTMISPRETFNLYKNLIDYISQKIDIPIVFKQRKTYREVNELLIEKKLDFAFICTGAYWKDKDRLPVELLVVPVVEGRQYYNAYVIVNKKSGIKTFNQLKGKSFAFTDPLSNTGYSYIVDLLKGKNTTPEKYFDKTVFTYAHDYSIQAVARNLVDGATVDGLVFDYLKNTQPKKIENVKIILKSKDFGIPPFVVQKNMDPVIKTKLKNVMLNLNKDRKGKELLKKIMIDKFIIGHQEIGRASCRERV